MNKKDGLLVFVLFVIAGALFFIFYVGKNEIGNKVVVSIDGNIYGTYPLDQDKEIEIETEEGTNTIAIKAGKVYMESADCPDKYCVKQSAISHTKESVICLPHKLVVEVVELKNDSDETEIDVIAE